MRKRRHGAPLTALPMAIATRGEVSKVASHRNPCGTRHVFQKRRLTSTDMNLNLNLVETLQTCPATTQDKKEGRKEGRILIRAQGPRDTLPGCSMARYFFRQLCRIRRSACRSRKLPLLATSSAHSSKRLRCCRHGPSPFPGCRGSCSKRRAHLIPSIVHFKFFLGAHKTCRLLILSQNQL